MSESDNDSGDAPQTGGLSIKGVLIRGTLFLLALLVLVIGGLFALSVIKGNIQYYQAFNGCESEDLQACYKLARHYCTGDHVAKDDWKCQSLLEQNCADGHPRSCTHAGWNYYRGDADREVANLAAAIDACEAGDLRGCHVAGSPLPRDDDRPEGADSRAAYSERACRGGLTASCHQWLWGLETEEASEAEIVRAAEVGCEQGVQAACLELAAAVIDEPDQRDKGVRLLEKYCPAPDDRCFGLVDHLEGRDARAAGELARDLCVRGVEPACGWLGEREEHSGPDIAEALQAYACQSHRDEDCDVEADRAEKHGERCAVDAPVSCEVFARFLARDEERSWDYERYRTALETACEGGMITSCSLLAYGLRHTEEESALSASLRERACEYGFLHHCVEPQRHVFAGYPESPDPEGVIATLEARCAAGATTACEDLVGWYGHTLEIWSPRDQLELAELYGMRACDLGEPRGCSVAAITHMEVLPPAFLSQELVEKQASRHERACAAGFEHACLLHGLVFLEGLHRRDPDRGKKLLEDYCRADHPWICWRLVDYYRNGEYVEKDEERAKTIEAALCSAGADEACAE